MARATNSTNPSVADSVFDAPNCRRWDARTGSRHPLATPVRTIASPLEMSDADFRHIAGIVEAQLGIKMPQAKKPMVASRLNRRLRELQIATYREYCEYLNSPQGSGSETVYFTDLITTHKTNFFREAEHFDVLTRVALPQLLEGQGLRKTIALWSAGCSSGQEIYTIRMVLEEYRAQNRGEPSTLSLMGTDVSELILRKAHQAIYDEEEALAIPGALRSKYLLRSKSSERRQVRIVPALRTNTQFQTLNFNDRRWDIRSKFHVIFCRNVLIYFDAASQERIIRQFCRYLEPGGYLFLGLSEGIGQMRLPVVTVARSVHRLELSRDNHSVGIGGR